MFDNYVGGMLDLAKNDCALSLWLAKTVLKEAGVIQIWFSHVPWTDESAHADKENMMKNMQQYLFASFQTGVFRMAMSSGKKWRCLKTTVYIGLTGDMLALFGFLIICY